MSSFLRSIFGAGPKKYSSEKLSQREKDNITEMSKADHLLEEFEKLISIWESNPRTFEPDTSTTIIQQLWDMIYGSPVLTFVGSVGKWFDDSPAKAKPEYQQIKPLLDKWQIIPDKTDQQIFEDFKADLKVFSDDYPKWAGQEWTIIEWFEKTVWKEVFQGRFDRLTHACRRIDKIMAESKGKVHSMISTSYTTVSPFEFEWIVADLFTKMGYSTRSTKKTCDYGIDVVAQNGTDTIAIQVKKYMRGNNVGNRDVQMLLGAMQLSTVKANKAIIITTSDFTIQAKEQAQETPVELWNGAYFNSLMLKYMT
jgi:Holliday junction resolvase-like predicted endonuclease